MNSPELVVSVAYEQIALTILYETKATVPGLSSSAILSSESVHIAGKYTYSCRSSAHAKSSSSLTYNHLDYLDRLKDIKCALDKFFGCRLWCIAVL